MPCAVFLTLLQAASSFREQCCQGTEGLEVVVARRPEGRRGSAAWQAARTRSSARSLPQSTCHPSLCIGNAPPSPTPRCFSLRGSMLSFRMADAHCLPPSSCGRWGRGGPCQVHPSPWHAPASQVSVSSRCCDMMTNTQVLGDWMRRALCLRVADTSSIMALIRPLRVSGLNFWLRTEFTAS